MSLRLRLALAFLLLSAVPLAGLALYSYSTSSAALRGAASAEAETLAEDLERRVGSATLEVDRGIRSLARLPLESWGLPDAEGSTGADPVEIALAGLGPALRFIEGISFVPRAPAAPPVAGVEPTPATAPVPPLAPRAPVAPEALHSALVEEQRAAVRRELERVRDAIVRSREEARLAGAAESQRAELETALEVQQLVALRLATAHSTMATGQSPTPNAQPAIEETTGAPLDGNVECEVEADDRVVGQIRAKVKAKELLRSVLAQTDRDRGEIPFALDVEGRLYVARPEDAERLDELPAIAKLRAGGGDIHLASADDWVVVTRTDPETGFRYGIARPLSAAMAELKRAAARNFTFGIALVGLALAGMVPISGRLVRRVQRLEEGAARLAEGDLGARVAVTSSDELGRLAVTFNRMAEQLAENQDRLLEQERLRKEEEIARRLLAAENERRRRELEEAREFQLSLLPRELPRRPGLDLAVSMTTATEVGGDYYDFLEGADGALVLAVGDATGHGAAAGTMVTAIKGLFAGGAADAAPATFLVAANAAVHRMGLVRRAMALAVARVAGRRVTLSAAGMPPALHFVAATGAVAELALAGTPLGARAEFPYTEATLDLAPGDALLFLSDGLPELPNAAGEPFGYERLAERFGELGGGPGSRSAAAIVGGLEALVAEWSGGRAPADDVTFLVLKSLRP